MTLGNKLQKKEFPFIDIFREAAQIVWQNKFLLWFGILMALGSPANFSLGNNNGYWEKSEDIVKDFIENHWQISLFFAFALFVIGIVLFLISISGKAGLILSINSIAQEKKTTFRKGWREGKKRLLNLIKLSLLFFLIVLVIVIVLALPVIYLAIDGSWPSAIFVGLFAVSIFIPLVVILALTNIFAELYIILSNLSVWSAIETGYNLLLKNIRNSIIFSLLLLAVNIIAGFVFLLFFSMTLVILVPAGILFFYLNKIVFGIYLFFAILLFLVTALFASSIFLTYKTTAWTLFFRQIAKIEGLEIEKVSETKKEEEIAAAPEKA